jgi:hypothetical protein
MEQLREVEGWPEFEARRKGRLDKLVDSNVSANFWEAADYEQFQRH